MQLEPGSVLRHEHHVSREADHTKLIEHFFGGGIVWLFGVVTHHDKLLELLPHEDRREPLRPTERKKTEPHTRLVAFCIRHSALRKDSETLDSITPAATAADTLTALGGFPGKKDMIVHG